MFVTFQDKTLRMNEVNALRKQIEREYLEKVRLEDQIIEELRGQLTMDKASQYTDKITKKLRTYMDKASQYTDKITKKLRTRTRDMVGGASQRYGRLCISEIW